MGIYKFKPEDAEDFARSTGIKFRHRGNQLEFLYCPFCQSKADKWTFGISMQTGQYECKRASCKATGNMISLSRTFNFSLGSTVDAYYHTVDYSSRQYRKFKDAHRPIESKDAAVAYMEGRGINEDICRKYEITCNDDGMLVFPFKDVDGDLTFIKYRNPNFKKGDKGSKEWCEKNCKPILFGMNHCDPEKDEGKLIITEGQIDSLSVAMAGYSNAVSVPTGCNGFTWVPHCWDFVSKFKQIIVMGDCENGKITLAEEISKYWDAKVRVVRIADYLGCKDANDILRKQSAGAIKQAIDNAEAPYNSHIKPMAKIKQVDLLKQPAIHTGIEKLDNVLSGGFRTGQVAIMTGKRGDGKSTECSMLAVWALKQGYKCFFYSGELPDFYFRSWMDAQITGKPEHTASEHDMLNAWYGDRAFFYDDTIIEDDEMQSLIKTIEIAIVQNGCKFIMIDNLMTAVDVDNNSELYIQQSKFVGTLKSFARKYDVFILLVAHPRKSNGASLGNDDISGSGQITDRADIVLSYSRPKKEDDPDENHRRISVLKNRLTGKLVSEENAIHLVYDQSSRRVASKTSDFLSMDFGWRTDADEFYDADFEEIPFE